MQTSSMAAKARVLIDGEELVGLVKLGEVSLEKDAIDVPGFSRIVKIDTGVIKMPEVPFTFETRRDTNTRTKLRQWHENGETHDVTVVLTDADGVEYERELWQDCRVRILKRPEVNFESLTYSQMEVMVLPYNIIAVQSQ